MSCCSDSSQAGEREATKTGLAQTPRVAPGSAVERAGMGSTETWLLGPSEVGNSGKLPSARKLNGWIDNRLWRRPGANENGRRRVGRVGIGPWPRRGGDARHPVPNHHAQLPGAQLERAGAPSAAGVGRCRPVRRWPRAWLAAGIGPPRQQRRGCAASRGAAAGCPPDAHCVGQRAVCARARDGARGDGLAPRRLAPHRRAGARRGQGGLECDTQPPSTAGGGARATDGRGGAPSCRRAGMEMQFDLNG